MASSSFAGNNTRRLFIAVKPELNSIILENILSLQKILGKSAINWVSLENMHLTIRFLGETPAKQIDNIKNVICNSIADIIPFDITFRNFGVFGKLKPKVIWIGIDECEQLKIIHSNITRNLLEYSLYPDQKVFSPHLTLARVKNLLEAKELNDFITNHKGTILHKTKIQSVILFESILKPEGPEYKVVSWHELN
jgi:2'-5' RNA ligase